jgi:hypothetical protein
VAIETPDGDTRGVDEIAAVLQDALDVAVDQFEPVGECVLTVGRTGPRVAESATGYTILKDGDDVVGDGFGTLADAIAAMADETGIPADVLTESLRKGGPIVDAEGCEWQIVDAEGCEWQIDESRD